MAYYKLFVSSRLFLLVATFLATKQRKLRIVLTPGTSVPSIFGSGLVPVGFAISLKQVNLLDLLIASAIIC